MEHLLASPAAEIQLLEGARHQLWKCVINTQLIVPQILKPTASNRSMCVDRKHFHFSIEEQSAQLSAAQLIPPASSLWTGAVCSLAAQMDLSSVIWENDYEKHQKCCQAGIRRNVNTWSRRSIKSQILGSWIPANKLEFCRKQYKNLVEYTIFFLHYRQLFLYIWIYSE